MAGEAGDIMNIQFIHHLLPMLLNRFDADRQFRRDLFVGMAFGDELKDLRLAGSEAVAPPPVGGPATHKCIAALI